MNFTSPASNTAKDLQAASVRSALLGKIAMADTMLYDYQVDLLDKMDQPLYDTSGNYNTASMWPKRSGLTTVLVIRALHHALFRPGKTAVLLLSSSKEVSEFESRLEAVFRAVVSSHKIPYGTLAECPGKLVVKVFSLSAIKANKSDHVDAVYIDTPDGINTKDLLKRVTVAVQASTSNSKTIPRFHVLTTGYHPIVAKVIEDGEHDGVKFLGTHLDVREVLDEDEIHSQLETNATKFAADYLCVNPHAGNSAARFFNS